MSVISRIKLEKVPVGVQRRMSWYFSLLVTRSYYRVMDPVEPYHIDGSYPRGYK